MGKTFYLQVSYQVYLAFRSNLSLSGQFGTPIVWMNECIEMAVSNENEISTLLNSLATVLTNNRRDNVEVIIIKYNLKIQVYLIVMIYFSQIVYGFWN